MCQACKQYGISQEYEMVLHPEYETALFNEMEQGTAVPKGLPAIEHFVIRKTLNAGKTLVADASPSKMTRDGMNPGYLNVAGDGLVIASKLQQALADLIKTKYKKYARGDKPSANDALSIALVDLTGKKLHVPELAGWGSTVSRNAASTAKIVFLYAIHQLRFDSETMLNNTGVKTLNDAVKFIGAYQRKFGLQGYNLSWGKIFDYDFSAGHVKVSFGRAVAETIINVFAKNNNAEATKLLHYSSYPYLGSLLWQSGLRHPTMGGLWVTGGYGGTDGGWSNRPSVGSLASTHNISALSAATFFTLLAQGRLVSDAASRQIKETLRMACSFLWGGSIASKTGIARRPPAKCGIWSKFYNDAILVEYDNGRYRYAACVLSDLYHDKDFVLERVLIDLDDLIRGNNP